MNSKRKIYAIIIALVAMVVLIFLSGTIYNFNKPIITATLPFRGYLNFTESTTGIVRFGEKVELSATLPGHIGRVLVREGDMVVYGQPLIEMDFRNTPTDTQNLIDIIYSQIKDEEALLYERLNNLRLDRATSHFEQQRISADIQNIERLITEQQQNNTTLCDFDIRQNQEQIYRAREYLSEVSTLFDAGVATGRQLSEAENNLNTLLNTQERLQYQHQERTETTKREQQSQLSTLTHQLEMRKVDQSTRSLDLETLTIREETLRREHTQRLADLERNLTENYNTLKKLENTTITATTTGIITNIPINQGQHVNQNQLLVGFGLTDSFIIESDIPLSNNFITVGITATLRNAMQTIEGVVTQVIPQEHVKQIVITTEHDTITSGETFSINFEERSNQTFTLVPNSSLGRDGEGYFLNQVRRRRGVLGDEFYTRRMRVIPGDSDNQNTAIIQGLALFLEPIVATSERPFAEGQGIRIRNEEDFFDN